MSEDNGVYQLVFQLTYRQAGARQALVRARDLSTAIKVGRAWCRQEMGRKFISVTDPVVADESILDYIKEQEEDKKLTNFEDLTVNDAKTAVEQGYIGIEEAFQRESEGQNRSTLLNWLAAQVEV